MSRRRRMRYDKRAIHNPMQDPTQDHTMFPPDHHLIGLTGLAHTGKDTAAAYLCRRYGFVRHSFAGTLKGMLEQMMVDAGVDYAWLHQPDSKNIVIPQLGVSARQMMQTLGDWGRSMHPDWWVRMAALQVGLPGPGMLAIPFAPVHDRIVFSDVRFPNEAAWIDALGGRLARLQREQAPGGGKHCSESHVHALPVHVDLVNNGPTLVGLHGLLDGFMADLGIDARANEHSFGNPA